MSDAARFSSKNAVRQRFSIPFPIISYMCRNPKPSKKLFFKLYFSCKFFYPKIKIISVDLFDMISPNDGYIEISWNHKKLRFPSNSLHSIDFKFCFMYLARVFPRMNATQTLLQKVWYGSECHFDLHNDNLTVKEYELIASMTMVLGFTDVFVTRPDGSVLAVEEILNISPNITGFCL